MTERPFPLDALVDLLVYVPVGLAKTIADEFPVLVARGKATVEPQLGTARLIGQFVVAEGRKRATGLWGFPPAGRGPSATEPSATEPSATEPSGVEVADPPTASSTPAAAAEHAVEPEGTSTTTPGPRRVVRPTQPAGEGPSPDSLAIPGYDSLSASQVVQRLAGLSSGELAAVGEYEAATRGRRTILTRVSQLQSS